MSISDTNNAKRYASIAETAAAQAKLSAASLINAPDYAAQAAASASAAASSALAAVSAEGVVNNLAISASESATNAAASAAEAGSAAEAAISRSLRVPEGEEIRELPQSASRLNSVPYFNGLGDIDVKELDDFAQLDSEGKIPVSMIPAIALSEIFVVNSQAAMLALTAQEGDIAKRTDLGYSLVLSAEPATSLSNWVQLNDDVLAQLGLQSGATEIGASDDAGGATTVQGALDLKQSKAGLSASTGSSLVGDPLDSNVANALSKRLYLVDTVTQLLAKNFTGVADGLHVLTYANRYGVKGLSEWIISSYADANTYSLALPAGRYANLVCYPDMNYSSFDFGGTDVQNVAAVDEGNRVARAQANVKSLSFPAGTYNIGAFTLDVDKRGFRFDGAGWDLTYLISTTSGISLQHVLIDPRNRARDREHYYQTVKGFTIDGNITGRGASASQRTVCSAHYANISYKSVGHILSNFDLCGLVIYWNGHAQGRSNGSVITTNCVRVRYNSIKLDGYIGGSTGGVNTLIHGPITTVASNASIGATQIVVSSAVGYSINDIIEISGTALDAKTITGMSGNTLTLDSGLIYSHSIGDTVRVPVCGTLVSGTLEVGQVQIGNSSATELHGIYSEESRLYLFGYIDGLEIHGCLIAQASPSVTIDSAIDRRSSIKIANNSDEFTVAVNIPERGTGLVNENIDLYNWPEVDIQQNPHSVQGIYVNGRYIFKSIKTERFYDSSSTPNTITSFRFTGFPATQSSPGSTEILRFAQNSSLFGYDGHTFNISASIRRANGLSGYLERKGQSSLIGTTISDTPAANYKTLSNYFSPVTGLDLLVGSNTGRVGIVLRGEDAGGQSVRAILSGEIISII